MSPWRIRDTVFSRSLQVSRARCGGDLRYFWIGRETLSSKTPGGSSILNALTVEMYCWIMISVSAPG